MFTLYYFEGPGYEIFPLRTRLNDIFTYQAQHAVNKYPDLADLGIELDDLSFEFDDGSHDLVHILDALEGPKDIWHGGAVCEDISPDACRQLRNGKWSMAVNVEGGNCHDLWDLMLRKWAPNCRYYYLAYGDLRDGEAESNDLKHCYFSGDYAVRANLSKNTPEALYQLFSRHTMYQRPYFSLIYRAGDTHFSTWPRQELYRELLTLVPMPELSPDDLADVVASTIGSPLSDGRWGTRVIIRRIHYRLREPHHYFMPVLEELRQKGQLR